MSKLRQPFRFPKRLWVVATCGVFLYLFVAVRIGLAGKFPVDFTAWKAFRDGDIGMGAWFSFGWAICALGLGAFLAAVLAIIAQLFLKQREP